MSILPVLGFSLVMGGMQAYSAARAEAAAREARNQQRIQQNKALELQKEQGILTARAQEESNKLYTDQQGQMRDQRQYDASVEAEAERTKAKSRTSRNALTIKYTGMNADDLLGIRIPT